MRRIKVKFKKNIKLQAAGFDYYRMDDPYFDWRAEYKKGEQKEFLVKKEDEKIFEIDVSEYEDFNSGKDEMGWIEPVEIKKKDIEWKEVSK